jgi:hypothetical protein
MKKFAIACVLVLFPVLVAADTPVSLAGFQSQSLKAAERDYRRVLDLAGVNYRKAVANADKTYLQKLSSLQTSSQVVAVAGESDRDIAEQTRVKKSLQDCSDTGMVLAFVTPDLVADAAQDVHKGMTKQALMMHYRRTPESDSKDGDGGEVITWIVRGPGRPQVMSPDEAMDQFRVGGLSDPGPIIERLTVRLKDDIVVDYRDDKNP